MQEYGCSFAHGPSGSKKIMEVYYGSDYKDDGLGRNTD